MGLSVGEHSNEILAYVAGIIDGEGCIHLQVVKTRGRPQDTKSYRHLSPRVEVGSTSLVLIEFLVCKFGGGFYAGKRPNRKPYYRWCLGSMASEKFLRLIYPYLVIKKEQADVCFRFRETFTNGGQRLPDNVVQFREGCYLEMQRLKRA